MAENHQGGAIRPSARLSGQLLSIT